jgi:putative membrane protein
MKFHVKQAVAVVAAVMCTLAFSPMAQAQGSSAGPTDPQIAEIVVVANQIDIAYGKLALKTSKDKEVRSFAEQMVRDHSAQLKAVTALATKLHVTPAASDTSKSLEAQSKETTAKLKALKGTAFDKAYVDNEVAYHTAVINAVTTVLIPNAKNAELKGALEAAGPLFQGHLAHAKNIQASLNKN